MEPGPGALVTRTTLLLFLGKLALAGPDGHSTAAAATAIDKLLFISLCRPACKPHSKKIF